MLAATNFALAQRISSQVRQSCSVLPYPVRWADITRVQQPQPGAVFGTFGGLRLEKGATLLAETVPRFVARHPDARFIIHAPPFGSHEPSVRALEGIPQIELIRRNFAEKSEYYAAFCRARCIMVPYDPAEYACRISGILLEAYGLGRPVLVSKGLSMDAEEGSRDVTRFVMPDYTVDGLLDALDRARLAMLHDAPALQVNRAVVSRHSPSAFCAALRDLIQA